MVICLQLKLIKNYLMKRNCQHDTLSIEDEISNEVDFENIVDGFPFVKAGHTCFLLPQVPI